MVWPPQHACSAPEWSLSVHGRERYQRRGRGTYTVAYKLSASVRQCCVPRWVVVLSEVREAELNVGGLRLGDLQDNVLQDGEAFFNLLKRIPIQSIALGS